MERTVSYDKLWKKLIDKKDPDYVKGCINVT